MFPIGGAVARRGARGALGLYAEVRGGRALEPLGGLRAYASSAAVAFGDFWRSLQFLEAVRVSAERICFCWWKAIRGVVSASGGRGTEPSSSLNILIAFGHPRKVESCCVRF